MGLLGPNGAGKSTLIQTLLGFHRPNAGRARILGLDCRRDIEAAHARIGYMPENDSFVGDMTAVTFVRLMAELSGFPPKTALEKAHEVLFHVGLGEARYRDVGTYSYGMKQMAKLAQAIVHGPELVDSRRADQRTRSGRSPPHAQAHRRDEGGAGDDVLLCSHLLRDIEQVCDEVVILKDGAHRAACRPRRRAARRTGDFVELEVDGRRRGILRAALSRDRRRGRVRRRRALAHRAAGGRRGRSIWALAARQDLLVRKMTHRRDSLEEIFLKAMGHCRTRPAKVRRRAR